MSIIGLTTTVPVEVIYAGGHVPVDLNNRFITAENSSFFVDEAENAGYPRNICGWIKGLYSVCRADKDISSVIAVTQGDCSNTHALMETLEMEGVHTIPFAYPYDRDCDLLRLQIDKLITAMGTTWDEAERQRRRLDLIRAKVHEIDRLTWQENVVSGFDNHLWQVSCSDFNSDPETFGKEADEFIKRMANQPERREEMRLGFIGVPPIISDIYDYLEQMGGRVVFNEVQRQFSMPYAVGDLVEQYRLYTYPYGVFGRLEDINREVERRNIDGIIHYVQSFCFRQIEDLIIRNKLSVPVLTIEGDKPARVDARTKLRIDSFLDMLR